jgi:hypothetical protein
VAFRAGSSVGASDLIAQTVLDTGTHSLSCVPTGPSLQRRGVRPGARGWSVVLYKTSDGPFNALPTIASAIMTPSVYYGNGTLSASNPFFKPAHVGGLIRLFRRGSKSKRHH